MSPDGIKTILIIDDDASVRQSIGAYLEDYNYTVMTVDSAESALQEIGRTGYDLAIVDLRLPGKSGSDFIEEASEVDDKMKFIIHTGSTNFLLSETLMQKGIGPEQVFAKPLNDMTSLLECIKGLR